MEPEVVSIEVGLPQPSVDRSSAVSGEERRELYALGDPALIKRGYLGLFASVRCPGAAILHAYDLARALRDAGVAVVGGFHSPMEKECLRLLLRGQQPVILCPARGLEGMRVPRDWRPAIAERRMLVVSPFDERHPRVTAKLADRRNALVADLAEALLVVHASAGGKIERLAQAALAGGRRVFVAVPEANPALMERGAEAVPVDVREMIAAR